MTPSNPGDGTGPGDTGPDLDEVVLTAAGLDPAERDTYLNKVAESAPELAEQARRHIEAALEVPESFLDASAAARLHGGKSAGGGPLKPTTLPPSERYELGERLGSGGMGRVVQAYDRQLGRQVALKFLTHTDPDVQELFLQEARAQASVRHPNVLDVYDSGELEGQPFITMRLVSGGTLAAIGPSLTLEQKVQLLAQVADGLHAAHRAGLVHRDVKPSNILVEESPDGGLEAQVADFGLALELADADSPAGRLMAGSPQFIAPERLDPDNSPIDRRSDVYSLGITMYWLLVGELPVTENQTTVRVASPAPFEAVPAPRSRMPSLPGELEAVILRCVAQVPEERYASAQAVAADLRRFLDGEVVEAYAASLAYRATRFLLRNRLLTGLAGLAAVVLMLAAIAVSVFAVYADAARHTAELRQEQAEELIRFMVVDLHEKLDSLGRLDVLDDAGAAAMEYFAAVPEDELSEAELLRRSRVLYQIGNVRIRQGDLAGAQSPLEQSLALASRLNRLRPDDDERLFELAQSHFWNGYVYWQLGDLDRARERFEQHRNLTRDLTRRDPASLKWQRELGYAESNLGSLLQAEGDLEGALAQFQATLAIDRAMVEVTDDDDDALFEKAATRNLTGVVLQDLGRMAEAREHLEADLRIRKGLLERDPDNHRVRDFLGTSHSYMGIHLTLLGEWSAAREHFERTRGVFEELIDHDSTNTGWQFKLAWSHINLGRVALAREELNVADEAFDKARNRIDGLLELDTHHAWRRTAAIIRYHQALAEELRGGRPDDSVLNEALEMLEALSGERPTDRSVHRWLGQAYLLAGRLESQPARAETAYRRAADVLEPFVQDSRDGRMLAPWATALSCLGRIDDARSVIDQLQSLAHEEPGLDLYCRAGTVDTHPLEPGTPGIQPR